MRLSKNELEEVRVDSIEDIDNKLGTKNISTFENVKNEIINNLRYIFYVDEVGQIWIPTTEANHYQYIGICRI